MPENTEKGKKEQAPTEVVDQTEAEQVESGGERVDFKKPFVFEGETFDHVVLDLDSLTGEDMEKIEREMQADGLISASPEISKLYHLYTAARAARKPVEFFKKLPMRDSMAVTRQVQVFLLGTD